MGLTCLVFCLSCGLSYKKGVPAFVYNYYIDRGSNRPMPSVILTCIIYN